MRLGYACLNTTLAERKIKVNRSMVKRTFLEKGIAYASSLALQNVSDMAKIISWNIENGILLYRMSSDMFPWMSEYEIDQLPDRNEIETVLAKIGRHVSENNVRLTYHPGPFNVLASPNEDVQRKTSKELRQHAEIMEMMNLPRSVFAKINIHVGGAYGDKPAAIDRFARSFEGLPEIVQLRLTIENDDKAAMFSVADLTPLHRKTGMPIVFDYLHHQFCTGGLGEEEALSVAVATWPAGITPVIHYSSSKKRYEDGTSAGPAHADFIYQHISSYGRSVDIMLEAKAKELAVLRYESEFGVRQMIRK